MGSIDTGADYWRFQRGDADGETALAAFEVLPASPGITWKGAGLIVDECVELTWRLPGQAGDPLKKLGAGTLVLRPEGPNPGRLDIGEGTAVLHSSGTPGKTRPVAAGVRIVSGRPTVRIGEHDPGAVVPDTVAFGFRGGVLDLNGNDWRVAGVRAFDAGARFTNTNAAASTFVLLDPGSPEARGRYADRLFEGRFEGNIDLVVKGPGTAPDTPGAYGRVFTGAMALSGNTLTLEGARVLMTGAPVRDAYLSAQVASAIRNRFGDASVRTAAVDPAQSDWDGSVFTVGGLRLEKAVLALGRDAELVTGRAELAGSALTVGTADVVVQPRETDMRNARTAPALLEGKGAPPAPGERARFTGRIVATEGDNRVFVENGVFTGGLEKRPGATLVLTARSNAEVALTGGNVADAVSTAPGTLLDLAAGEHPARLETASLDASGTRLRLGFVPDGEETGLVRVTDAFTGGGNHMEVLPMGGGASAGGRPRVLIDLPAGADGEAFAFEGPSLGFIEFKPVVRVVHGEQGRTLFVLGKEEAPPPSVPVRTPARRAGTVSKAIPVPTPELPPRAAPHRRRTAGSPRLPGRRVSGCSAASPLVSPTSPAASSTTR